MMKKLIAMLALSLSIILCLTACGAKMPYDLSGTASVELHAYDTDSTEPFAQIVVDGEDVGDIVEMFSSLKLKELDYTEPSINGYDFWSAPGSDDRGGRPYAPHIGSYVTKVDVTHILSGQLQEWTVDGEQLDALREWANGLEYEHRTYADGQSPGDTNGGEIYDFVLTEGDYPGFTYVINGPDDCHLVIEGEWFVVNNPSTPPITAP
jgi:predicted small lipoprotein YifL